MLDNDFRRKLENIIDDYLSIPIDPSYLPRLKQIWRIEGHEYEFLYGESIGFLTGIASGMIIEKFGRDVTDDENNEIFEIVESHARRIRESLTNLQ